MSLLRASLYGHYPALITKNKVISPYIWLNLARHLRELNPNDPSHTRIGPTLTRIYDKFMRTYSIEIHYNIQPN